MKWIVGRLREPSSAAGLAAMVGGVSVLLMDTKSATGWAQVLGGLAAIIGKEGAKNA